jgi:hypothetical protein
MLKIIAGRLALASIVVASGLVLGGVAWAGEQAGAEATGPAVKHSEAMEKSKSHSHEDAREATKSKTDVGSPSKKHSEEMRKSKSHSHEDATEATKSKTDVGSPSKVHSEEMEKSKSHSHEDAREATKSK